MVASPQNLAYVSFKDAELLALRMKGVSFYSIIMHAYTKLCMRVYQASSAEDREHLITVLSSSLQNCTMAIQSMQPIICCVVHSDAHSFRKNYNTKSSYLRIALPLLSLQHFVPTGTSDVCDCNEAISSTEERAPFKKIYFNSSPPNKVPTEQKKSCGKVLTSKDQLKLREEKEQKRRKIKGKKEERKKKEKRIKESRRREKKLVSPRSKSHLSPEKV